MSQTSKHRDPGYSCDSQCVDEFVECMTDDYQKDDPMCKTRQEACIEECPL